MMCFVLRHSLAAQSREYTRSNMNARSSISASQTSGSIATSSLVTILVLALGVLLLVPLQPILQSEALQPAFSNVVPALFGAMAYKYFRKNMKIALAPLIVMSVLFILVPALTGSTSFMIIPSGALAIGIAYFFYKKQTREAEQK